MKTLLLTLALLSTITPGLAQEKYPEIDTKSPAAAAAEKAADLKLKVKAQLEEVEKARQALLEVAKRPHIVDLQAAPATPPAAEAQPASLSAELETLHAKAEPAQKEAFQHWLDQSLTLCNEDANFRQAYTSLLQEAASLAQLKASGLGLRHPKIMALEAAVRDRRSQLSALAAQRRERLRKELLDGVKSAEKSKTPAAGDGAGTEESQRAKGEQEKVPDQRRRR